MKNYWISPEGKKFKCDNHGCEADRLIRKYYGKDLTFVDYRDYLLQRGWIMFRIRDFERKIYISENREPTQAQRDAIFDLTGQNYSEDMKI